MALVHMQGLDLQLISVQEWFADLLVLLQRLIPLQYAGVETHAHFAYNSKCYLGRAIGSARHFPRIRRKKKYRSSSSPAVPRAGGLLPSQNESLAEAAMHLAGCF